MDSRSAKLKRLPVLRQAGSPWTGAVLIGLIVAYLAIVSVLAEIDPQLLERLLRTARERVYGHWILIALGAALCLNLAIATITRIPLDAPHAGAWCSHLGAIVLAVGVAWYAASKESGHCFTHLTPAGWSRIDRFHPDNAPPDASKPLPGALQVEKAEYLTYPGSAVPKDFRCEVLVAAGGTARRETLSLNNPIRLGPYQIGQGSWLPTPEAPTRIVFIVASRPGLPIIWFGLTMVSLGFPYAFYVKPILLRRRRGKP